MVLGSYLLTRGLSRGTTQKRPPAITPPRLRLAEWCRAEFPKTWPSVLGSDTPSLSGTTPARGPPFWRPPCRSARDPSRPCPKRISPASGHTSISTATTNAGHGWGNGTETTAGSRFPRDAAFQLTASLSQYTEGLSPTASSPAITATTRPAVTPPTYSQALTTITSRTLPERGECAAAITTSSTSTPNSSKANEPVATNSPTTTSTKSAPPTTPTPSHSDNYPACSV